MIKTVYKRLQFEYYLVRFLSHYYSKKNPCNWWDKIGGPCEIYLGAIPFTNRDHLSQLQDLGIQHVLSCIEPFETKRSLFGSPVSKQKWEQAGMHRMELPIEDFTIPSLEQLHLGSDFIHEAVQHGPVYVHCKAGRGRSASMIAAYLIKYHHMEVDEAVKIIKKNRPIVKLESCLMMNKLSQFHQNCQLL
ncbi:MAG: dual specificity protein phosphatase family protein [Chlamydiales bacterium]|nr:dual specificity protein phosphatase family protein [Chlamydiales bacterium]